MVASSSPETVREIEGELVDDEHDHRHVRPDLDIHATCRGDGLPAPLHLGVQLVEHTRHVVLHRRDDPDRTGELHRLGTALAVSDDDHDVTDHQELRDDRTEKRRLSAARLASDEQGPVHERLPDLAARHVTTDRYPAGE